MTRQLNKSATQYEELLFIAARNFIIAAAQEEKDLTGEWMAIDSVASADLYDDKDYWRELAKLFPNGEQTEITRRLMYQHFSLLIRRLRRRGKLDTAPLPVDHGAADYLGSGP